MALLKDSQGSNRLQLSKTRIIVLAIFMIAPIMYMVGNLFYIQILHPERLIAEGNARVIRNYKFEPPRGLITDRKGKILAISVPVKTVDADPKFLHEEGVYKNKKKMQQIADILEMDVNELYKKTSDPTRRYVQLKRYLELENAAKLAKISRKGLVLNDTYRRSYPTGEVNAQLVGILNGEGKGIYGVEQSFNRYLTSTATTNVGKKDRYNNVIENDGVVQEGTYGGNIILSIDNRLQAYTFSKLKERIEEVDAEYGMATLLDVKTGEVLSMVSYPSFDPNNRVHFDSTNAQNRTVSSLFEPGSTVKPIIALAALEAKSTNWKEVFDTRPFIVDGKVVKDSHAMASGTVFDIIKFSSNTGMARIAMRIGPHKAMNMLNRYGLGYKTGSLLVGESAGVLNEKRPFWADIDKAVLGFGYGISVTNLQMVQAYANLARGGVSRPLTILRRKNIPEGKLVSDPRETRNMIAALESVVDSGTGGKAAIDRYRVAGKTGTAKIAEGGGYGKEYTATFAGFAPISDPRFAMVVVISKPHAKSYYGGTVSGPVFSAVMSRALQVYNIKPDKVAVDNTSK